MVKRHNIFSLSFPSFGLWDGPERATLGSCPARVGLLRTTPLYIPHSHSLGWGDCLELVASGEFTTACALAIVFSTVRACIGGIATNTEGKVVLVKVGETSNVYLEHHSLVDCRQQRKDLAEC